MYLPFLLRRQNRLLFARVQSSYSDTAQVRTTARLGRLRVVLGDLQCLGPSYRGTRRGKKGTLSVAYRTKDFS